MVKGEESAEVEVGGGNPKGSLRRGSIQSLSPVCWLPQHVIADAGLLSENSARRFYPTIRLSRCCQSLGMRDAPTESGRHHQRHVTVFQIKASPFSQPFPDRPKISSSSLLSLPCLELSASPNPASLIAIFPQSCAFSCFDDLPRSFGDETLACLNSWWLKTDAFWW